MKKWFAEDSAGRNASRWFARLRDADVTESTDEEFGRWLTRDPRNEEEFERRELLWEVLGELQSDPEVLQLGRSLLSRSSRPPRPRFWLQWGLAGAVLAAVVLIGYWQIKNFTPNTPSAIQERVLATGTGEQKQILLADGSRVVLNTGTRIHERFSTRVRWLKIEHGEAVFQVRHDVHWPFVVIAGRTSTLAVGTAFDVLHLADRTDISVLKGRVQVDASSVTATHQQIGLSTGQSTAYTNAQGLGPVSLADLPRIAAWQRHRIEFHDDTLASAVSDFNRYIMTPIVLGDASLATIRVSGVFRCHDDSAFIRALYGTFGIRSEKRGNTVVLLPGTRARRTER